MASRSTDSDELEKTWYEKPDLIRAFVEIRPQYEQLCSEIEYILRERMNDTDIEYSAITSRAKTLRSFVEKLSRKQYDDPLQDVPDLAGVRLVYLYKSDRPKIERIIESEFAVIEKEDKVGEQDADRFGYGALHYLVRLGRKSSGARYDRLKDMVCEIQVRTALQDAWAIISHHLNYKQESDVPRFLQRELNSLSAMLENSDGQFDEIRKKREAYKDEVKKELKNKGEILDRELNLDSFVEFLNSRFPEKKLAIKDEHISWILSVAAKYGYTSLSDLDRLLNCTEIARKAMAAEKATQYAVVEMARAIALKHPEYRASGWSEEGRELLHRYEKLCS
jgi:ppGpp synthetase/RelA/SpoT-type nucleotidyltranferase